MITNEDLEIIATELQLTGIATCETCREMARIIEHRVLQDYGADYQQAYEAAIGVAYRAIQDKGSRYMVLGQLDAIFEDVAETEA